jgi:hypothetical protein
MLTFVRRFYLRRAIRRGASLQDREGPAGWNQAIDKNRLDISERHSCVLGQLYGTYGEGKAVLAITAPTGKYGFNLPVGTNDWDELNDEWRKFLTERETEERKAYAKAGYSKL